MASLTREERAVADPEAYAAARSAILSAWSAEPTRYLTPEACQALCPEGTAADVVKQAHTFLLQHGMINAGAVLPEPEPAPAAATEAQAHAEQAAPPEPPPPAGPSLGKLKAQLYEILRTVDFEVVTEKQIRKRLAEGLGVESVDEHKAYVRKHVQYVVDNMDQRETIDPMEDEEEEEAGEEEEEEQEQKQGGKMRGAKAQEQQQRVLVLGAGAAGLAAASTLKKAGADVLVLEPGPALPTAPCELLLLPPADKGHPLHALARQAGLEFAPLQQQQQGELQGPQPRLLLPGGRVPAPEAVAEAQRLFGKLLSSARAALAATEEPVKGEGGEEAAAAGRGRAKDLGSALQAALDELLGKGQSNGVAGAAAVKGEVKAEVKEEKTGDGPAAMEGVEGAAEEGKEKAEGQGAAAEGSAAAGAEEGKGAPSAAAQAQPSSSSVAPASASAPSQEVLDLLSWHLRCVELTVGAPLDRLTPAAIPGPHASSSSSDAAPAASNGAPSGGFWQQLSLLRARQPASGDTGEAAPEVNGTSSGSGASVLLLPHEQLLRGLASGLDIRYGCHAERVTYGKKGVKVVTTDGDEFEGALAIIALPLSGLMPQPGAFVTSEELDFSPALPAWKTGALSRLRCGAGASVLLRYESPFWLPSRGQGEAGASDDVSAGGELFGFVRPAAAAAAPATEGAEPSTGAVAGPGDRFSCALTEAEPAVPAVVASLHRALGAPYLLVQFAGDAEARPATDAALRTAALDAVASMFPGASAGPQPSEAAEPSLPSSSAPAGPAPEPQEVTLVRWGPLAAALSAADKSASVPGFSYSLSYLSDTATAQDLVAAAAPVKNRLCFAGDHAVGGNGPVAAGGHLAAALMSGFREAARALAALQPTAGKSGAAAAPKLGTVGDEEEIVVDAAALEAREEARAQQEEDEEEDEEGEEVEEEEEEEEEREAKAGKGKKRGGKPAAKGGKRGKRKQQEDEQEEGEEKPAKKGRRSAAAAAVAAMDRPGGLGEYDPKRAELELAKRREAREEIKQAHKAMIQAGSGNLGPLWEVLTACNNWDGKQQLTHVLVQASPDALDAIAADAAILKIVNEWLEECCTMGPSMEHLVKEMLRLLARLPTRVEVLRGSGVMTTVRTRCLEQHRSKDVRKAAEELLGQWVRRPGTAGAAGKPAGSAAGQAKKGPAAAAQPSRPAAPALPSVTQAKIDAAEAMLQGLEQEAKALAQQAAQRPSAPKAALPTIPTFDEFNKSSKAPRHKVLKPTKAATPHTQEALDTGRSRSDSSRGAGTSVSHKDGAKEGPQLLEEYVKKHLHPHVKGGAISKEQYAKIKDKVVRKVADVHQGTITSAFFTDERRKKVKGIIEDYVKKYRAEGAKGR